MQQTLNEHEKFYRDAVKISESKKLTSAMAFQLRTAGISFEEEFRFHPERMWRFDFAIPYLKIAIEVEGGIWRRGGGAHSHPTNIMRDLEKYNAAAFMGWAVFRFSDKHIRDGYALNLVRMAVAKKT